MSGKKRSKRPMLLCFSRRSDLAVVSPKKNQHGGRGIKKQTPITEAAKPPYIKNNFLNCLLFYSAFYRF
ncbi:MAG: hypothetical protein J6T16_01720, partial [Opitutales bacterium]|nr:hypothetical protein [Opitutales bacterium]